MDFLSELGQERGRLPTSLLISPQALKVELEPREAKRISKVGGSLTKSCQSVEKGRGCRGFSLEPCEGKVVSCTSKDLSLGLRRGAGLGQA